MDRNMTDGTIAQVVKDGLCTGCGTCVALCPNEAIKLTRNEKKGIYVPELNEEKCNNCSICYEVCPGHEVDFKELNLEIFGKESEDILIGNYLDCYIGHSTNYDIRYNSASGGLVTQLLIFALEEGLIDGALVTRMKKENPLEPEPFIARTGEEIIEASKSKYCPVPANIALKEILNSKEGEKFAVVGLPCHLQGIRKAEQKNKKLKERIVLHLGLFCHHGVNFIGTEFLLQKLDIRKEDIVKFDYRGQGWPGSMLIELKNGDRQSTPHYWTYPALYFFIPDRCMLCSDALADLADISFGDAWLPELYADRIGSSVIISRTKIGEQLLQRMRERNKVELKPISVKKVVESQKSILYFKKKSLAARRKISQIRHMHTPLDNTSLLPVHMIDYILAICFMYPNQYASSVQFILRMLKPIPWSILLIYRLPFYTTVNSMVLE